MPDFGEPFGDAPGHPLRGGVRVRDLRVGPFEGLQLPVEAVVLVVADLGSVVEVVEPVVTGDLGGEGAVTPAEFVGGAHGLVREGGSGVSPCRNRPIAPGGASGSPPGGR